MSDDKLSAYQTLYACLMTVAKLLAPFAPFYADQLYKDLNGGLESVHLEKFPVADDQLIDEEIEYRMKMAQNITSQVLAMRKKVNINVRQPLQCILVPVADKTQRERIAMFKDIVLSETNVKELNFADDGSSVLVKKVKCNFRTMGKKFGGLMKAVAAQVAQFSQAQINELESKGEYVIDVDGQNLTIELVDVEVISEDIPGWLVSNDGNLTVALDIEITDTLRKEGMARELINRIQNMRKDSGLEITDRIKVTIAPCEQTDEAVAEFGNNIKSQVLADEITIAGNDGQMVDIKDFKLNIKIEKTQ